jgi:hypothetical protein
LLDGELAAAHRRDALIRGHLPHAAQARAASAFGGCELLMEGGWHGCRSLRAGGSIAPLRRRAAAAIIWGVEPPEWRRRSWLSPDAVAGELGNACATGVHTIKWEHAVAAAGRAAAPVLARLELSGPLRV